ncbi:DUF11 domain-containing protein [Allorhodopirellula solitaria]|uniref:Large cysteine-rich periplasmic protein OmcB n=1 Tax=Allorhodopirellula solitaria TaxID=2527987 RepID=A0A5C5WZR9_9BACT|nr:DUF11 domain-containing protein [Allorhodopirellula solitaria]TWT56070.1 Large cysteine-rich periplasmic protein OmcB precursor [Allorhodopirellula solitaria]
MTDQRRRTKFPHATANTKRRRRRISRDYRRRLHLEPLENRRLLAAGTDLANLSGLVYNDFNGDGFTPGEQVVNASVTLYRDDGDGQFEPDSGDSQVATTPTDADGRYTFERLTAGQYFVLQPAQDVSGVSLQQAVSPPVTITAEQVAGQLIRTIDGFDGAMQTVSDEVLDGVPVTSTADAPEAIGGSRDLLVNKTSDIGTISLVVNDPVSPDLLQVRSDGFGGGQRVVIWDGADDDPTVVNDDGLGGIDLTSNGEAAGMRLVIGADLPAGAAIVRLYTDDGNGSTLTLSSTATLDIPQTTTQPTSVEFVPFSDFTTASGASGPADLTSIGAIEFEVVADPNYDALADLIGTIGPNLIPVADFDNYEPIDLNLSKELITADPNVNLPVSFRLTLLNEGESTATNVVVTDNLPAGITYSSDQPSAGSTYASDTGLWTIPSLAPGATVTLELTGLLTSNAPQTNTAQVTAADQFDVDSTPDNSDPSEDDQDSAVVTAAQINLALDKTVSEPSPNVGDPVSFTLTLSNSGIDDATNIVVQDTLPPGLTISSNEPASGTFNPSNAQWTIPSLAAGQSTTLLLNSTVTAAGSYTNVAEVIAADQFDTNSTPNNNDPNEDDQDQVTFQTQTADLSLAKTVVGQVSSIGDNVTFSITVNNEGPNPATNVRVRDVLPAGLTYVSDTTSVGDYDSASGDWTIAEVPVGTPVTLNLVAEVTTTGTKTNTAEIMASDQSDPDSTPGNGSSGTAGEEDDIDSVMLTPVAIDLELSKTTTSERPAPGETFTYNLTVTNTSADNATGVRVTDQIPVGLIFQSSTVDEDYAPDTGVWNVGSVPAGESRTIAINVSLDPSRSDLLSPISNTAEITAANEFDIDSTPDNHEPNEDDQMTIAVTPANADLSLTKTVENPLANVGEDVTFTITATNSGPDPSGSFVVADPLPEGAVFVDATTENGSYDPGTQRWSVAGLELNETATLTLVLRASASGTINNVAEIVSASLPDPDSTPGNGVEEEDDQAAAVAQAEQIDLSLTKDTDNPTPRAGETFSYTITIANGGPDTATNIVVADRLPDEVTLVGNEPASGSFVSSTGLWTIPSLAAGESTTLKLDGRIDSIAGLPSDDPIFTGVLNTAEVMSVDQTDSDSTPGNDVESEDDQDSVSVRVPIADLSVEKTTLTPNPNIGENARFEIVVQNAGPDVATNIVIADTLPPGLTYLSDSQSDNDNEYASDTGLWTIATLGVGQSVSMQLVADVELAGMFTNTAELISVDQDDPDSTPNNQLPDEDDQSSATLSTPVIDLSLQKTNMPLRPSVGSEVTFTLEVLNDGPDDATGVVVSDELPDGFEFLSSNHPIAFSPLTGLWNVGALASGESQSLEIRGNVISTEPFENLAEVVAADQFDSDSTPDNGFDNGEDDTARVTVTPASADLSLTKTVDDDTPNVGDDVVFTLTVRNDGPDTAAGIEVLDTLPPGLTDIRADEQTGSYDPDDRIWRIDELESGSTAVLTLTATVDRSANDSDEPITRTNFAEIIASSQFDPDSTPGNGDNDEDDSASVSFVPQLIDLALTKTSDSDRANVGDTIEYRVTVSNDGPTDATGVVVSDPLPAGLTFVSATPSSGENYNPQTGDWSIPQIPAGETRELILNATVSPDPSIVDEILASGITNIAEVIAADQPDRDSTPDNGPGEDDYQAITLEIAQSDLSLTKTVDNATPDQNDIITFLVTVNNSGPDTATNIVVNDALPVGLSDVQVTALTGDFDASTNHWTIAELESGGSAQLQIRARVTSANIVTNVAEIIAADQLDPNSTPGNSDPSEDDMASVQVIPRVIDVSVEASAIPEEIELGDTVEVTVTVHNGSSSTAPLAAADDREISDATGVVVGVTIPEGLTLIDASPAGVYDAPSEQWTAGEVAANSSKQLILTFRVDTLTLKTFEIEVLETNEIDIDSTAGNHDPEEDDQTSVSIHPPATLSKRLFMAR